MKRLLCLTAVLLLTVPATRGQVFISEYVEGTTTNKAIEIYNGSGATIDLMAAGYRLRFYIDGGIACQTVNLAGLVAPNDVHVLAHPMASPLILSVADQTAGSTWFDGNDAVELVQGATVLDVLGQIGVDPGTEWGVGDVSTRDNTLRRKYSVVAGDPVGSDVFDPAAEWDGFAMDTYSGLGTHASALPAELSHFEALVAGSEVCLRWGTVSETNNAGYYVEHRSRAPFAPLTFIDGHGTTSAPQTYAYCTDALVPGRHHFRLRQVDFDGTVEYSREVEAVVELMDTYQLTAAYPNPFNPVTRFSLTVRARQPVRVEVLNLLGQSVQTVFADVLEAQAPRTFTLDAGALPSGMYLIHVVGERFEATQQVTLLK